MTPAAWSSPASCVLLSYSTVLLAELVGDKSIYTVTSLALRFRPPWVFCGVTVGFMGKMLAAVLLGQALGRLPAVWVDAVGAAAFLGSAAFLWLHRDELDRPAAAARAPWRSAVGVSFLAIFFSEWADFGQLSAASLAARHDAPAAIWLGGTLALCTKGAVALTLGTGLRRRIPARLLRTLPAASCLAFALHSLYEMIPGG